MKMPAAVVALSGFIIVATACAPTADQEPAADEAAPSETDVEAAPSLEGAWRVAASSVTTPDTSFTNTNPQPSLYIFLERHYSVMFVPGNEPRALFSGDQLVLGAEEPTDAEKIAAFDSFIANSGTYEVTGSTLTTRPIVAKTPNFMAGESLTFTYEFEGESLRLTLRPPWAPDIEIVTMLTRLE
jgi:hypothetical protein